ncbi:hypothetical protein [Fundidesulfovibrio soli]|uniref:hypothetical protein n=1 Tax=Fundidesulfovibrio soli TaxID=2922716 RepID=UPI001FAED350|nr:hypothetical protein [Fundidesulfovibrio soli]
MTSGRRPPGCGPDQGGGAQRPPVAVLLAVLLLLAVQLTAIMGLRGAADPEGYPLNTSKPLRVNTFEDDGVIGLRAALGYSTLHEDRFSYLFGVGGPVLHAARPVMAALDRLGLITRFEDPSLYLLYPRELERAYKAFAVYQLLAFTMWLPLAGWLLLSRHVSRPAGIWAAWLLALTPFLTGFETRLKPDSAALLMGILSLHFALNHLRDGGRRNLLAAWGLLGLSASIKLTCVPFAGVLLWLGVVRARRDGAPMLPWLAQAAAACAAAFLAANPLPLFGLANIARWLGGYMQVMHAPQAQETAAQSGNLGQILRHLLTLDVFFGPVLKWAYPAALVGAGLLWAGKRFTVTAWAALWAACLLQMGYMAVAAGRTFAEITYYYYTSSALGLLLLSCGLGWVQERLGERLAGRDLARRGMTAVLAAAVLLPLANADLAALRFVTSPSNRQLCHGWIERNVPQGASVGVPLGDSGQPVSQFLRVDPFRWAVVAVGVRLELLAERRPGYLVTVSDKLGEPAPDVPGYSLVASFDGAGTLPRDQIGLFQDEVFRVYRCEGQPLPPAGKAQAELALGDLVRSDPEQGFQVLQYQATRFYPITLDLFAKSGGTLLPYPTAALAGSLRHASSPAAFVHHAGPLALTLWGVKYVFARQDGEFRDNALGPYGLERLPAPGIPGIAGGEGEPAAFLYPGYGGQAFFAPDAPWTTQAATRGLVRLRPLPGAGRLLENPGGGPVEVRLEIESDGPADVVLTGGPARRSYLAGPGATVLHVPYEGGDHVDYELNPAKAGGTVRLLKAEARPMPLAGAPVISRASVTAAASFAQLEPGAPGRVLFALPWHHRWKAEVDGKPVRPEPGPAGVVAVPVPAGARQAALRFAD